jgi:hypothetical protein
MSAGYGGAPTVRFPRRVTRPSIADRITGAGDVTALPADMHCEFPDSINWYRMSDKKSIYRIVFHNQGNVIELYAREVSQTSLYAFVEVGDLIFGERSQLVVDPSEEQLKSQFAGVKRTYLPLHSVVRIDEVEKEGTAKVLSSGEDKGGKVTPFPLHFPPGNRGE